MLTFQYRDKILELIKENNIKELKCYIEKYNISLKELNQENFDILIYAIENNSSLDIIKFIIQQCVYNTLNYTVKYIQPLNVNEQITYYKVPLFSSINLENFKISNFLLNKHANINYKIQIPEKELSIVDYLYECKIPNFNLNLNKLKYILKKDINIKCFSTTFINLLVKECENNLLNLIFKHYVFNVPFILILINFKKHNVSLSNKQLQELYIKEKNKIIIKDEMYEEAIKSSYGIKFKTIELLLSYDCRTSDNIMDTICQYNILEKAVKNYNCGYNLIKKILSYKKWKIDNIHFENAFIEALKTELKDIVNLFLKTLKENIININIFQINKIIIESIKRTNNEIIMFFIKSYLDLNVESIKNIDFKNILNNAARFSDVSFIKFIFNLYSTSHLNNELEEIDIEVILLNSCQNPRGRDIIEFILDLIFNHKLIIKIDTIPFNTMLLEASQKKRKDIIKLIIEILLKQNTQVFNNEIFEKLFIELYNFYDTEFLKFITESLLKSNIIDRKTVDFENIILKTSTKNYSIDKDKMEYLLEVVINQPLKDIESWNISDFLNFDISYQILLLNISIKIQNLKLIQYIIENNNHLNKELDINNTDKNCDYPIFTAYHERMDDDKIISIKIFHYLLQKGANCNLKNKNDSTLLLLALKDRNYLKEKYILEQNLTLEEDYNKDSHPVITAIYRNDINSIKTITNNMNDHFIDMNDITTEKYGFTLLILSYLLNHQEIFQYLLQLKCCNINQLDRHGYSLIHYAILKEDLTTVTQLINNGSEINYYKNKRNRGNSAIDIAISINNKKILGVLLKSNQLDINRTNHRDEKPIITVIKSYLLTIDEKINLINYFIQLGADININFNCENSPLTWAIYEKSLSLVKLFIELGVNINLYDDNSPLISAIEIGYLPIIQFLIKNGADVNFIDPDGYSALVYAMEKNQLPIIKLLIQHGANYNLVVEDEYGLEITILNLAIIIGDIDIIKYLMENHAEITFDGELNYSNLVDAIYNNGKPEIFNLLKNYNIPNFESELFQAIIYGHIQWNKLDLLNILIKFHFDINVKDVNGDTPIVYAIENGNGLIANYLIDCGVNLTNINNYGESIYDISYRNSDSYWGQQIYNKISTILHKK